MDIENLGTEISLNQVKNSLKTAGKTQNPQEEALQSFGDILQDNLKAVDQLQHESQEAIKTFATGGDIEMHQVMIAMEKAEASLEMAVQVRNRLVQAYQEINRMGI